MKTANAGRDIHNPAFREWAIPLRCYHTLVQRLNDRNWTPLQVSRSGIHAVVHDYDRSIPCTIHYVNVDTGGFFTGADKHIIGEENKDEFWRQVAHEAVR